LFFLCSFAGDERDFLIDNCLLGKNIMSDLSGDDTGMNERAMGKRYIESKSSLVSKNITVSGRRTSVRLEPEMWAALKSISKRENCSIHDLCSLIALRKKSETSLTAAIRVFLMLYFRAASTEAGHDRAGHGDFQSMKVRAGMDKDWSATKAFSTRSNRNNSADFSVESRLSPHLQSVDGLERARAAS